MSALCCATHCAHSAKAKSLTCESLWRGAGKYAFWTPYHYFFGTFCNFRFCRVFCITYTYMGIHRALPAHVVDGTRFAICIYRKCCSSRVWWCGIWARLRVRTRKPSVLSCMMQRQTIENINMAYNFYIYLYICTIYDEHILNGWFFFVLHCIDFF